jgi:hypothetical protein
MSFRKSRFAAPEKQLIATLYPGRMISIGIQILAERNQHAR